MKTIMLVIYVSTTTKINLRGNFLLNMTYHITRLSILRDCSFWTLSNCVTHSFTTTASSSLLNIHCHFAWIPFSLHNIWITNLVSTCRSIWCNFLPFQIIVLEFLHSRRQILYFIFGLYKWRWRIWRKVGELVAHWTQWSISYKPIHVVIHLIHWYWSCIHLC